MRVGSRAAHCTTTVHTGSSCQAHTGAMDDDILARVKQLVQEEHALAGGDVVLYYQPQVDLATQSVVGAEALIRWNHPIEGLLLPDKFLPDVAATSLMPAITEWVIATACAAASSWASAGVAVNVA